MVFHFHYFVTVFYLLKIFVTTFCTKKHVGERMGSYPIITSNVQNSKQIIYDISIVIT